MRKAVIGGLGFLALAGLIGYAVTGGAGDNEEEEAPSAAMTVAPEAVEEGVAGEPVPGELPAEERAVTTAEDAAGGGGVGSGALGFADVPLVVGPHIVKTAELSLEVRKGSFGDAFDRASLVAGRYGGFVSSSSVQGAKSRSGTLVLRVPAASFDQALADLRALGEVEHQAISGEDVTAQFVDLEARLLTWEAQEAVLLRLMRQATTVEGTLRVQRDLQDVQLRIEQIKGQLRVLEDRSELATITASIREAGAPVPVPQDRVSRPSLSEAWDRAVAGFLGVTYSVVVGLGYLVPLTLLALAGWLGYRRLRPRITTTS